jgi:enoyl-CoA hydratase/carnithine racemase
MTDFQTIEFDIGDDHVATITLNRPERLNCFNQTMAAEMTAAWTIVRDTDAIHAVVLRANGDRAFCTGIDIQEGMWWGDQNIWNQVDPGGSLGPRHHRVWKPVIAAINGMCAGGGMYFVNESDIVICSDDATFFDPHANGGIVSALEPIGMVKRGVPLGDVLRWALMGTEERIGAATALRMGLVSEVTLAAELRNRAHDIAGQIAARRPEAVQGTVRAIWEALDMTRSAALQNGMAYTHIGNPKRADRASTPRVNRPPVVR